MTTKRSNAHGPIQRGKLIALDALQFRTHPSKPAGHSGAAIASGVSDTLWSLADMVRVIEAW
jgi:hypothetical protein